MRRIFGAAALFLFALATAASAGGSGAARPRVVSLSPALTEIVCHLGGESLLAGRSRACDRPSSVLSLPVAGDFGTPNLEAVVSARADVVITDTLQTAADAGALGKLGVKTLILPLRSFAEYRRAVTELGLLLDRREEAAREIDRVDRTLREYRGRASAARRVKVWFLAWHEPWITAGRKAFITEMLELAGGENIGAERDAEYFACSPEWVLTMRPEVIIYPRSRQGRAAFSAPEWWKLLPAVRDRRFFQPEDESLFCRLSPRFPETLRRLSRWLHPGTGGTAGGR